MAEQFEITRIKKPGGSYNRTTHITEVYVLNRTSTSIYGLGRDRPLNSNLGIYGLARPQRREGWFTVEAIIAEIESGNEVFYTDSQGKRADVIVVTPLRSQEYRALVARKFIKTKADNTAVDNLLSLPNDYIN